MNLLIFSISLKKQPRKILGLDTSINVWPNVYNPGVIGLKIKNSILRKGFLEHSENLSELIVEEAFWRLEELWDSWLESRFHMRQLITKSIVSNIRFILDHGNDENFKALLGYAEVFEDILREEIFLASPEIGAKIFKEQFKTHPLMPPVL